MRLPEGVRVGSVLHRDGSLTGGAGPSTTIMISTSEPAGVVYKFGGYLRLEGYEPNRPDAFHATGDLGTVDAEGIVRWKHVSTVGLTYQGTIAASTGIEKEQLRVDTVFDSGAAT